MKTVSAISVSEPCYFVQNGCLRVAEDGEELVLHTNPVWGRRDIDAETARQMIASGRAEPSAFAEEFHAEEQETVVDGEAMAAVIGLGTQSAVYGNVIGLEREAYRG